MGKDGTEPRTHAGRAWPAHRHATRNDTKGVTKGLNETRGDRNLRCVNGQGAKVSPTAVKTQPKANTPVGGDQSCENGREQVVNRHTIAIGLLGPQVGITRAGG